MTRCSAIARKRNWARSSGGPNSDLLDDETPQKKLAASGSADLLRRRLSLEEPVAAPLPLAINRDAAA
jgi:hypothetical protein